MTELNHPLQPAYAPDAELTYRPDHPDPKQRTQGGQKVIGYTEDAEVSVPRLPYENWLDPSGNVVPLVISTNRDPSAGFDEKYARVTRTKRERRGWVRWDVAPYGMSAAEWCEKREELRQERQARAREKSRPYSLIGRSEIEKLAAMAPADRSRVLGQLERGLVPPEMQDESGGRRGKRGPRGRGALSSNVQPESGGEGVDD